MKTALKLFALGAFSSGAEIVPTVFTAAGIARDASPMLPDSALTASSQYDRRYAATQGRLNNPTCGWEPSDPPRAAWKDDYWQVDLGTKKWVGRFACQGNQRQTTFEWGFTWRIKYSDDGITWTDYGVVPGNTSAGNKIVTTDLRPFKARYVRVHPETWNSYPCGRFEFYVADVVNPRSLNFLAAGIENSTIPDSAFDASSTWSVDTTPSKGRLNLASGGWAAQVSDANQWWQVDLGVKRRVGKIATQGRDGPVAQWITSYRIKYSDDAVTWTDYHNGEILTGNTNITDVVTHDLINFRARYVRILPVTWNVWIAGRFELYVV